MPSTRGVPILVLSAYDGVEFRAEALESGCAGYMVKPVAPEALLRTVEALLGQGEDDDDATSRRSALR